MWDTRVRFALDHFIVENYFLEMSHSYHLKEEKDTGKSDLILEIANENLCIYDFDNKGKCQFVRTDKKSGMQKSVDHMIFEKCRKGWKLHLIEMKSSVGYKTWLESIKPKVRTSYFTALAIADFLGIRIQEAIAYTTYENDKFDDASNLTNPRTLVPLLGLAAWDANKDEWKKDRIILNVDGEFAIVHRRIQMKRNSDTGILEGKLTIEEQCTDEGLCEETK